MGKISYYMIANEYLNGLTGGYDVLVTQYGIENLIIRWWNVLYKRTKYTNLLLFEVLTVETSKYML